MILDGPLITPSYQPYMEMQQKAHQKGENAINNDNNNNSSSSNNDNSTN